MSFLNNLANFAQRAVAQVNPNDNGASWSHPAAPVHPATFTPAPIQHVSLRNGNTLQNQLVPVTQQAAGNDLRNQAQKNLGFTPAFSQNVANAQPFVGKPLSTTALLNEGNAAAEYTSNLRPNQIVIAPTAAASQTEDVNQTMLHEGLHRVWDTNPQVRKQFAQAYDSSATPALRQYIQARVAGYTDAQGLMDDGGVYTNDFSKLESLPNSLQDEVHSYVPQYPAILNKGLTPAKAQHLKAWGMIDPSYKSGPITLPPALNAYYQNYYNPTNQPAHPQSLLSRLKGML